MKNIIEYIIFLLFSELFQVLGIKIARKCSFIIALIFYYIIPIRKNTVLENLKNAFPEYDSKKIKKVAFGSYKSFAIALTEILCLPKMNDSDIKRQVEYEDMNLIREKYEENKGVILLSAHFGNWEYIALSAAVQLDIPFTVIVKSQRNPYVTNWMNNVRTKWNNKIVSLGISIRQVYETLKDKQVIAMVADQRGPVESVKVNFFGRSVSVHTGPAILALKTGAPILYGIAVRQDDYVYKAKIVEISTKDLSGSLEEKIREVSQRHMSHLEAYIRRFPDQWLWMHKRWKH